MPLFSVYGLIVHTDDDLIEGRNRNILKLFVMNMTITVTKQDISQEICGELCMIAESNQDRSFELDDKFVLVRKWNDKGPLTITWRLVLQGFHCYGTNRIPEFISRDWNLSFLIYKKLKGL
jgi:hypothetical protein